MTNDKYVIVHADDLGMCNSVNEAIFTVFEGGYITSASIMAPCAWVPEVIAWSKNHRYDLGAHITLTCEWNKYRWRPITDYANLRDEDGYMVKKVSDLMGIDLSILSEEMYMQIDMLLSAGINLSHVDSHMFACTGKDYFRIVAEQYSLPYLKKVSLIAETYTNMDNWIQQYSNLVASMKPGLNQLLVHPGLDTYEMKNIMGDCIIGGYNARVADFQLLQNGGLQGMLKMYNVTPISWKQVKELGLLI